QLGGRGELAVEQQVGRLEERAFLRELLDRVAAIAQDALVAIDVRDGAAAGRRVHERGIVEHQAEIVDLGLDLPEVGGANRPILDGELVALARTIVDDGERVLRHYGVLDDCGRKDNWLGAISYLLSANPIAGS